MVRPKKQKSENEKAKIAETTPALKNGDSLFPVVGIGASAGGLVAIEQFLESIPAGAGMAYVVVQHLDPTQKGMLPELLQRITKLTVLQAKERMKVKPDHVYVIPPNKTMSISNGVLHLFEPREIRGLRLPIDFFFRSLADDKEELAVGVILSGMGSDGTVGLGAIKEKGGLVVVQEPGTAKYDSMPRSAFEAMQEDIVCPVSEMPQRIIDCLQDLPIGKFPVETEFKEQSSLDKIIFLLREYTGNDFSLYKKSTMYRRVERRMDVHNLDKIARYATFLQENPREGEILFKELMIGVTNFFRDPRSWDELSKTLTQAFIKPQNGISVIRAWIPGCSTGEEAYSLAILFKEAIEKIQPAKHISFQVFATDLDLDAIENARRGFFPLKIANEVSPERLARFFIQSEEGFTVCREIREMIVFAQHNLIMHPPFVNIDIISCRNLLIYMDIELQKKILGLFFYSLNKKGVLFLGSSETLGTRNNLFTPIDSKHKIFTKKEDASHPDLINFPSAFSRYSPVPVDQALKEPVPNIQAITDRLLLQSFAPPGVLVNPNGDIIYISGRTGKYLEPAMGKANMNIFPMLREGLRQEFPIAFYKAVSRRSTAISRDLVTGSNDSIQHLNVTIHWNDSPEALKGTLLVIFTDIPDPGLPPSLPRPGSKKRGTDREVVLESELRQVREEIQSTLEEMQTAQEELKSTNEELQSANEELQSANEELTSSKEEMQSLNEELQTVNSELLVKVDDFSRIDNDMKNLLNSTDIATLFLDEDLNIRRYTKQATKLFKLIKSDIGRPFTDQSSDLVYPDMVKDAMEVLRTQKFLEKQIPGKNGNWFSIRIMPYWKNDDKVDGLVITFINISELKQVEEKWHELDQVQRFLLKESSSLLIKISSKFAIQEFNPAAEKFFDTLLADALHKNFLHLCMEDEASNKALAVLNKVMEDRGDGRFKVKIKPGGSNASIVDWSVKSIANNQDKITGLLLKGVICKETEFA